MENQCEKLWVVFVMIFSKCQKFYEICDSSTIITFLAYKNGKSVFRINTADCFIKK